MTRQHQSALSRLGFRDPDKENPRHGLACEYLQEKMRPYVRDSLLCRYRKLAQAHASAFINSCSFPHRIVHIDDNSVSTPLSGSEQLSFEAAQTYIESLAPVAAESLILKTAELSSLVTGPSSGAKGFLDVSFRGSLNSYYALPERLKALAKPRPFSDVKEPTVGWIELDRHQRQILGYPGPTGFAYWGEVRIQPTSPELLLQQIEFYASNLDRNDMIWVLADFDLSDFKRMAATQFPQIKCFQLGPKFEEWCHRRERPDIPEL